MVAKVTFIVLVATVLVCAVEPTKSAFTQASISGARPIARKDKVSNDLSFETAHKLPPSLTYLFNEENDETEKSRKKRLVPAPAPSSSIKIDAKQLIEKYRKERLLVADAEQRSRREVITSPKPVFTSVAPMVENVEHTNTQKGNNENKRSRIQIKKGPNGQEYEYEYVYYYDDEIDDTKVPPKQIYNSHDGPAIDEQPSKSNDVIVTNNSIARHLNDEDISNARLPTSTRFPPRNSPLLPKEDEKVQITTLETDKVSLNSNQVSRSKIQFNTNNPLRDPVEASIINSNGPSFPVDLPTGPVRFLGATPNERVEPQEVKPTKTAYVKEEPADSLSTSIIGTTKETLPTLMSPMDKVALDLYAILQSTQKVFSESDTGENSTATDQDMANSPTELHTDENTAPSSTSTTTTTTTTTSAPTTTTTTPSPTTTTTTTTPESPAFGRGRFRGRTNTKKYGSSTTAPSSTEGATQSEGKPKSRYGRPGFNRPKSTSRAPSETNEVDVSKNEVKPVHHAKPTTRSRFGSGRTRPSTTTEIQDESASSTTARPTSQRARPSFNTRTRGRTTSPPTSEGESSSVSEESSNASTPKTRLHLPSGNTGVKPLRPGPRINLARGRPGVSTTTTTSAPDIPAEETSHEETSVSHEPKEATMEPPASTPEDKNPLNKLRKRPKPVIPPSPSKFAGNTPVQIKRVNPLLAKRRPGATAEPTSSTTETSPEPGIAESSEDSDDNSEPQPASSTTTTTTTTEEPRGLNKLLAGRRLLRNRQPGTINNSNN